MAPGRFSQCTSRLVALISITCLGAVQYGYHISSLNAPQDVISCATHIPGPTASYEDSYYGRHGYVECIAMDSSQIGLVTSIFSIGGLFGALYAGSVADRYGRRTAAIGNSILYTLGSLIMMTANGVLSLAIGRFVAGMAAGCAVTVIPLYINEITPALIRGIFGSMNQLAINAGILLTQTVGLFYSNSEQWRNILFGGVILGFTNLVLLFYSVESPKFMADKGRIAEAKQTLAEIQGPSSDVDALVANWVKSDETAEQRSLLTDEENHQITNSPPQCCEQSPVSALEYLFNPVYRPSVIAVLIVMTAQQLTGINSIVFYGVIVLKGLFPQFAILINIFISLVNTVVTGVSASMVDQLGRKLLLLCSLMGMAVTAGLMSLGIVTSNGPVTALATFLFVISFASGLGPIPFLLISEFTQPGASGQAQSVGMATNWVATFIIAFLFPVLNQSMGGYVYLLFTASALLYFFLTLKFIPESKGKNSYNEIWGF